ncbi:MAG TPA: glycosyltransferase family 4 protein [Gammaproteobacteria bacterium]|nr:glycosyltransferase family 4 protein [Gammaproteobacteria bacterium]
MHELCRRLVQADHSVDVLTPRLPGAPGRQYLDGVHVTRFGYWFARFETLTGSSGILARLRHRPWRIGLIPCFMLGLLWALNRSLRSTHYDLIHAHWLIPQGILAAIFVPLVTTTPLICTAHGSDIHALRGPGARWLRRKVLQRTVLTTVVSQALCNELVSQGASPDKLVVAPMGVDFHALFVPDEFVRRQQNRIVFVGRLIPLKGVDVLLKAFAEAKARHPALILEIIGDGPERRSLETMASTLGIQHAVEFSGALPQAALPPRYSAASIAVVPSLTEGFGLVALEAMGCGCAVIASDLPALESIVLDEETGLLFPPGDTSALKANLCRLFEEPPLCHRLAENGRRMALQLHDWSIVTQTYLGIYHSATCRAGARGT